MALLPDALMTFDSLKDILIDAVPRSSSDLLALWSQLHGQYFPGADPLLPSSLSDVNSVVTTIEISRKAAALQPDNAPARVRFQCQHLISKSFVHKQEVKEGAISGKVITNKADAIHTSTFDETASQCLALIDSSTKVALHELYQIIFKSGNKLLQMYIMELTTGVQGSPIFMKLSKSKGKLPAYNGWCLSVDEDGFVPTAADGKAAPCTDAIKSGDFAGDLHLLNLCKTWERLVKNKSPWVCISKDDLYQVQQHIRCMMKYGDRLFEGIGRAGSGKGSFKWVCEQGIEILDSEEESMAAPGDVQRKAQWWFDAALREAGELYAAELKKDTDFCQPLEDVFLPPSADCIRLLQRKNKATESLESWVADLPETASRAFGSSGKRFLVVVLVLLSFAASVNTLVSVTGRL